MGNGKRGMGKYNGKLIFSCFFFFRLTVYSEEQIFFNDFHVLFQKLSKAKFKERNKLMIRKEVIFREQIMSAANYKSIFSRKLGCSLSFKYFATRVKKCGSTVLFSRHQSFID